MTEENEIIPPQASEDPKPAACSSMGKLCWLFLGVAVVAGLGTWSLKTGVFSPALNPGHASTDLVTLERRMDTVEAQLATLSALPQERLASVPEAAPPDVLKGVEARIAQMETRDAEGQASARKLIAAVAALWDLRHLEESGRPFVAQAAALRTAVAGDAALEEQALRLESFSVTGAPSLAQLREALRVEESALLSVTETEEGAPWWVRLKQALRPLLTVRPTEDARLIPVKEALAGGDAVAAAEGFKALPEDVKNKLAAWREKLDARIAVDESVRRFTDLIVAPAPVPAAPQEGAP